MSGRVHERKFDWDEALRLRADGLPIAEIAARFGVSYTAVYRIVMPGAKAKMDRRAAAYAAQPVPCIEGCGRTVTLIGAKYHGGRCVECAAVKRSTTARDGELRCAICGEWKPDDEFPRNRTAKHGRRGRHGCCRVCQTIARREYRNRHKVPCAAGCGTLVLAPNEQQASARSHGRKNDATGLCRSCWWKTPEGQEAHRLGVEASRSRRSAMSPDKETEQSSALSS